MEKFKDVDDFMRGIDKTQQEQVSLLRSLIIDAHPELAERIKWNSPSYALNDVDRITFSVRPKYPTAIVLHMGALRPEDKKASPVMDDPSELITWKSDTRGVIYFTDLDDIKAKSTQFVATINRWLKVE